jgi:adenine phosphoribosyltransferase
MPEQLKRLIPRHPRFPKPGIVFRDITPLLADPSGLAMAVELLANPFRGKNIDLVVGAESRGLFSGRPSRAVCRRGSSLCGSRASCRTQRISMSYDLEYGKDTLEMHADAIVANQRVLIVDDLLATGGTIAGVLRSGDQTGGTIAGIAVLIELTG